MDKWTEVSNDVAMDAIKHTRNYLSDKQKYPLSESPFARWIPEGYIEFSIAMARKVPLLPAEEYEESAVLKRLKDGQAVPTPFYILRQSMSGRAQCPICGSWLMDNIPASPYFRQTLCSHCSSIGSSPKGDVNNYRVFINGLHFAYINPGLCEYFKHTRCLSESFPSWVRRRAVALYGIDPVSKKDIDILKERTERDLFNNLGDWLQYEMRQELFDQRTDRTSCN